jgi:hypothetical protein
MQDELLAFSHQQPGIACLPTAASSLFKCINKCCQHFLNFRNQSKATVYFIFNNLSYRLIKVSQLIALSYQLKK